LSPPNQSFGLDKANSPWTI